MIIPAGIIRGNTVYAFSGEPRVGIYEDDWTAVTMDNSRAAQAEHTILITESGCEILTL